MNLNQLKKKLSIFMVPAIFVILIILALIIITVLNVQKQVPQTHPKLTPIPTPTFIPVGPGRITPPRIDPDTLPVDIKKIRQNIIASQIGKTGGDIMLLKSESYVIRYIPAPDVFFVTIFKDPAQTYKTQAESWFLNFGLKQTDLCDLPVRFILGTRELRASNPKFSSLPNGCI